MKLILHIVRKDLLRLRWYLALGLVGVALKLALGFGIIFGGEWRLLRGWMGGDYDRLAAGFMLWEGGWAFALTAMLVQADALVGTGQFWCTRPISGARLLLAKLAGWLLLVWLPAVVLTVPWWLTCGFGPDLMAGAAAEMFGLQLLWSAPAVLVAVFTGNSSRFIVWAFVLLFGLVTIPVVLPVVELGANLGYLDVTRVVFVLAVFVVAVAVAVRQFLTRDTVRSLVWFGAGLVAAVTAALVLPRPVAAAVGRYAANQWTELNPERGAGVGLTWRNFFAYDAAGRKSEFTGYTRFDISNIPAGLLVGSESGGTQTWRWPEGVTVARDIFHPSTGYQGSQERAALGLKPMETDPETARFVFERRKDRVAALRAVQGTPAQNFSNDYVARMVLELEAMEHPTEHVPRIDLDAALFASQAARIRRQPSAYEATVRLRLVRPEVRLESPVSTPAWRSSHGHGLRIGVMRTIPHRVNTALEREEEPLTDLHVPFVTTRPHFLVTEMLRSRRYWDDWRFPALMLVNRRSGYWYTKYGIRYPSLSIGSVGLQADSVTVTEPVVRRGDKWVPRQPDWAQTCSVVVVGYHEEARFNRTIKIERFEPPSKTRP